MTSFFLLLCLYLNINIQFILHFNHQRHYYCSPDIRKPEVNIDRLPKKNPIPCKKLKAISRLMSDILNFFSSGSTTIRMKMPRTFLVTFIVMNCSWYQPCVFLTQRYHSLHSLKEWDYILVSCSQIGIFYWKTCFNCPKMIKKKIPHFSVGEKISFIRALLMFWSQSRWA